MGIWILLTSAWAPIFAFDEIQLIEKALASANHTEKLSILENISTASPFHIFAVEELIKIFYSEENWPRFFAYAQYYRSKWEPKHRNSTQILELLALLRHCQTESLQQLIVNYRKENPRLEETLMQIETLSRTEFQKKANTDDSVSPLKSQLKGETLWKISNKNLDQHNPKKLRIKVENKCSS